MKCTDHAWTKMKPTKIFKALEAPLVRCQKRGRVKRWSQRWLSLDQLKG